MGVVKLRIGLLSNVTVDLLAGMLKKTVDVYLAAGFNTWQQEILLTESGLSKFNPDAVVVLLHAGACEWENIESGFQIIDNWCKSFSSLLIKIPKKPVFISSIDISIDAHYGAEQRIEAKLENYLIENIQKMHSNGGNIYILPVKDIITDLGRFNFYSNKMWYIGSMPYSMSGLTALNELITRYIRSIKGRPKKCMAVDLDNTLWGGVIGEDGIEGIQLSNHKEGQRYYDTQKILKKMKNQGVMLAILSKNNPEDVEPVFSHPDMILQHDDFVAEVINWNAKSENIKQLAKELNISLDSFVFLDDNIAEREQMIAECPDVTVIDFPTDSSQLPNIVARAFLNYFLSLDITKEDVQKTAMYKAESKRKAEKTTATSLKDYLINLDMIMNIHFMTPDEEKRVAQITNKTNQFNVTTKRYSEEEIRILASSDKSDVITVHMADKYGDQGLVSVLILNYKGDKAKLDSFLMSCRVMGRKAEVEIIANVKKMLEKKGIKVIYAQYLKTAKNAPVVELFDGLGFEILSSSEEEKNYKATIESLPNYTGIFKEVKCEL